MMRRAKRSTRPRSFWVSVIRRPGHRARGGRGSAARFAFPRPLKGRPGCDFSLPAEDRGAHAVEALAANGTLSAQDVADVAASFQAAVVDSLADRTARAIEIFSNRYNGGSLWWSRGVAANSALRTLTRLAADRGLTLVAPPARLCTDNAR